MDNKLPLGDRRPLDALTGLRFVAAAAVFLHHLGGKFGIEPNPYSIGALAVTFFFVLSGFILTYVYHDRLNSPTDVRRFWFTRFARIWPLHVVCLIIAICTMFSWSAFDHRETWWKLLTNLVLLQSWIPDAGWAFSFNVVSWTISTEAFFYLLFPALCFTDGRQFWLRAFATLGMVGTTMYIVNQFAQQSRFGQFDFEVVGHLNPLFRLPEFCIGMIAGYVFVRRISKSDPLPDRNRRWTDSLHEIVCLAMIAIASWMFSQYRVSILVAQSDWGSVFLGSWLRVTWPAIPFGITICVFARSRGILSTWLSSPLIVYLGEISYSFYMIHFLVIRQVFHAVLSYGELPGWAIAACCFAVSIGLSISLYRFVEVPAKQSLLNWYQAGTRAAFEKFQASISNAIFSPLAVISVALIAVPIAVLATSAREAEAPPSVLAVIADTRPALRNIDFGGRIKLLGCRAIRTGPKRVELQLAWAKRVDPDGIRIVLLQDGNGQRIGRGTDNRELFETSAVGYQFVDTVQLPINRLKQSDSVVVNFKGKDQPALTVDRGPRTANRRGLIVLTRGEIKALLE